MTGEKPVNQEITYRLWVNTGKRYVGFDVGTYDNETVNSIKAIVPKEDGTILEKVLKDGKSQEEVKDPMNYADQIVRELGL